MKALTKKLGPVALGMAVALSAGSAMAKDIVLGYMPASMIYPYNVAAANGFKEQAEELGAKVVIFDPQGSVEKQANGLEDFITQGVNGIAMLPLDGKAAQTWADRAAEAGIPFVSVATLVGDSKTRDWKDVYPKVSALVGMDNVAAGAVAGKIAVGVLPKGHKIKIAIVEGAPGYPQVPQRTQGFRSSLDAAKVDYEIIASQPTDWTSEQGEAVCQNVLTAHPDVDLFFVQADPGTIGCAIAVSGAGVKVPIVSGDGGSKEVAKLIADGQVAGSACDRPHYQGRLAAKALFEAVTNPATPKGRLVTFDVPATTKDTLSECPPEY